MLKSTHHRNIPSAVESPLPRGWSEHKAPSGHTYYYNAETKQSTYTRPTAPSDEPLQIDYGATEPDHVLRASMQAMESFHQNNGATPEPGRFTGGKSYQDHSRRRGNQGDRPKSKATIPNCTPWVLVMTKLGRRFVHNTETKQSLWKFPQDVMMAVIEMDRLEWEAKKFAESQPRESEIPQDEAKVQPQGRDSAAASATPASPAAREPPAPVSRQEDYDSDSYEEVEVTDDEAPEDEEGPGLPKRPRLSQDEGTPAPPAAGPVEFDEDDIAWQLAQMEEDYGDGAQDLNDKEEDEDDGLPLTASDNIALFRSLLDDCGISPYSTFEKLIEDLSIVEDTRWVALPNTTSRKEAFVAWSKDRIVELQARKESEKKTRDPKVEYLHFLQRHATPKLYWPEFKRKFKKEPELRDVAMQEKDREKLYREFVAKLKTGEAERRKDLVALLKGADKATLQRDMDLRHLPDNVLRDLRFYTLDERRRDELVRTFLETQ
ncbi:hypothetical protein A1O3_02564 [Capronia epimyces CBS 606.96]|uniref:WW domain-containing protein n=1 Tax=Capronia epimyces CBS 606.96 TaxID=1182542 RepID=W9Y9H8_9EURO|nr:uncharacterized protein A1O3_02564 [Capronia epimyces CBS 606.96]EXJ89497.1 hypothetical protein A1O3_02564 [Capronia epimyces CBS 606.96]